MGVSCECDVLWKLFRVQLALSRETDSSMVRIKSKELLAVSKGFLAPSQTPSDFRRVLILQSCVVILGLAATAINFFFFDEGAAFNGLGFPLVLFGATVALGWVQVGLYFRIIIIWAVAFFVLFLRRCVVEVTSAHGGSHVGVGRGLDEEFNDNSRTNTLQYHADDEFDADVQAGNPVGGDAPAYALALAIPANVYQIAIAGVGFVLSAFGALAAAQVLRRRNSSRSSSRRRKHAVGAPGAMTEQKLQFLRQLAQRKAAEEQAEKNSSVGANLRTRSVHST